TLEKLGKAKTLKFPCMGIVDADCDENGGCLMLPGRQAPERQVFADLAAAKWPRVAERLGIPPADIQAHLEDASLLPDHHQWCSHIGNKIHVSKTRVWENLAAIWASNCVSEEGLEKFVQQIRDRMQ